MTLTVSLVAGASPESRARLARALGLRGDASVTQIVRAANACAERCGRCGRCSARPGWAPSGMYS